MELVIAEAVAGDDEAAAVIGHVTIEGLLHIFVQRFGGDIGDNHGLVGEVVAGCIGKPRARSIRRRSGAA